MGAIAKMKKVSVRDEGENSHRYNLATSTNWSRQSNTFGKSLKRAPILFPVSLIFSIWIKKQCCVLYPFRNLR